MGVRARYTVDQVAEALRVSAGIYTIAGDKLGCAPNTVKNYVVRHRRLQEVEKEVKEQTLDLAESKLLKAIGDGNMTAIIFYLKCKGKERGYIERNEVTGAQGGPVAVIGAYLPKEGPE